MVIKTNKKAQKNLILLSKLSVSGLNQFLAIIFYLIWILVGLFMLIFIYGNIRQGILKSLFTTPSSSEVSQAPQTTTETTLPGVGTVNIACVQNSLTTEAIQKILASGDNSQLTDEEKAKLDTCIVESSEDTKSPPDSQ